MDPTQNQPSTPIHNPSVIDLTTQNPQYSSTSYQTTSPLQNNHPQMPLNPKNTHHQTAPPSQNQNQNPNQNAFNFQTPHHHLNKNTNPQAYPQNYQISKNVPSPSIAHPYQRDQLSRFMFLPSTMRTGLSWTSMKNRKRNGGQRRMQGSISKGK